MGSMKAAIILISFILVFILGIGIMNGLAKLVKLGLLSSAALNVIIALFIFAVVGGAVAFALYKVRSHSRHLAQSSSKDILSDIIKMGEDDKNSELKSDKNNNN